MFARAVQALWFAAVLSGQQPGPPPDPAGIQGARILAGGGRLPAVVRERFVALAGGAAANIVLVPTAGARVDEPDARERIAASWRRDFPQATFTILHTRDRATADSAPFVLPLRTAGGVWFGGGVQRRLAEAYLGTAFERELLALCARGGVVGGTSAGTAIQTRTMIQEGKDPPIVGTGFDLLPWAVVDQHFTQRQRLPRLLAVLGKHGERFGLGIDESTAVEARGRTLTVLGEGTATLTLAGGQGILGASVVLKSGEDQDLVTWQRAAWSAATDWAQQASQKPTVAAGTLVLCGGGRIPATAAARFVEVAGGKSARVVLVLGALPATAAGADPFAAELTRHGVTDVRVFAARTPQQVAEQGLEMFADASGVWFTGGRQWRLCDAFDGTPAIAAFHAVLARGGVIGGSSAGATIQADFLVRGNPRGNAAQWCRGYDRGFGFLPGCAVDQHFLARNRTADLQGLIAKLPDLIGLGIDEHTAAIVHGTVLEVVGDSKIAVFDVRRADAEARQTPQPQWLEPGARWDLEQGRRSER